MTTRVIMLIAMVTGLSMTAAAAAETLPLACQGTVTETMMEEEKKPEPISMGSRTARSKASAILTQMRIFRSR
jgi:uncharacterized membrane protein